MIEAVFALVLMVGASGSGHWLLGRLRLDFTSKTEKWCFAVACGWSTLIVGILILGVAGMLYVPLLYMVIGAWSLWGGVQLLPVVSAFKQELLSYRLRWANLHVWLVIATGIGLGLNLLIALAPPHGSTDPLAYQLALPKIYLAKHALTFEPTLTGALYPNNMGLLYVVALALRNGVLAQVLHWCMGVMVCVGVYGWGRRHISAEAGIWGATIFSFFPVLVVFAPQGYIDVGLCFFQFMAFWALSNWLADQRRSSLLLAALLTGMAMGTKHQGLATPLIGTLLLIFNAWQRKRPMGAVVRDLGLYGGLALLMAAPWYVRAYAFASNPIWPLANDFFGGFSYNNRLALWKDRAQEGPDKAWWATFIPSLQWLRAYWYTISPWELTFRPPGLQKFIGVYFVGLLPGVLLYGRQRKILLLSGLCVGYYMLLMRVLHANPRYGIVLFAFLSLICGHIAAQLWSHRIRPLAYVFAVGMGLTFACNIVWQYTRVTPLARVVMGLESREYFLQTRESSYSIFRYVNRTLPSDSTILLQGIVKGFYCERNYLWDHGHQGVLRYQEHNTPEELLERMRQLGISHVVRMIKIPQSRLAFYPQYFLDPYHEEFRRKYLKLLHQEGGYVVFEVRYPS